MTWTQYLRNLFRGIAYASLLKTGNETRDLRGKEIRSFIEHV